jgi:hypothetical protein
MAKDKTKNGNTSTQINRDELLKERLAEVKISIFDKFNSLDNNFESLMIMEKLDRSLGNIFFNKEIAADRDTTLSIVLAQSTITKKLLQSTEMAEDVMNTLSQKSVSFVKNMDFDNGMEAYSNSITTAKEILKNAITLSDTISEQVEEGNASSYTQKKYYTTKAFDDKEKIITLIQDGLTNAKIAELYKLDQYSAKTIGKILKDFFFENMELFKSAKDNKKTLEDISAHLKINTERVKQFADSRGIKFFTSEPVKEESTNVPVAELEKVTVKKAKADTVAESK